MADHDYCNKKVKHVEIESQINLHSEDPHRSYIKLGKRYFDCYSNGSPNEI